MAQLDIDAARILVVGAKGQSGTMLRTVLTAIGLHRIVLIDEPRRALELLGTEHFDAVFVEGGTQLGDTSFALAVRHGAMLLNPMIPIFAVYDGAPTFGATLHEMIPRVDSGLIVGCLQFPVPPGSNYQWLAAKAHQAALHLFLETVDALACSLAPLPPLSLSWGARQCSLKALEQACCLPNDISAEELERRCGSFGQVLGAKLYVMLSGRRFELAA